ncbi:hypothetical protein BASA61_006551 [Batrachochytrium salamandrivorans]|nr:hypothetical protein BASA61_006551 [Batrachochytrium salamandrivorans]KAH9250815.1 hypothetical protein BASA81_011404 [Batrachochytrium salamandrivorans]KAH9267309.1 hypothetical protein BASA83_010043 [Batrachochytrium salamandrivorans]
MRLIFFAMVSLLAITVSAWPPHNPDTQNTNPSPDDAIQNMDQSPGDAAEDLQYFQESDIEMLEEFLNDITQNVQQPQGAATHSSQQPPDAYAQNVQQSPDAATQSAQQLLESDIQILQYFQDSDIQVLDRLLDDATQSLQQPPDAATQNVRQSPDTATQSLQNSDIATSQNMHQSQGAATQNVQQPPDAATQSEQPSDQNKALAEMERLTKVCNTEDSVISEIERQMHADKRRDAKVNDMMKAIAIQLRRPSLSDHERLELQQKSYDLRMVSDELVVRYKEQHQNHKDATKKSNYATAALQLFKDNQKLIAEHNSKNEAQVGLSPNFDYSIDMLREQYDKVLKDIDVVLAEQKRIKGAMLLPGGNALKAQSKQLDNTIRTLQIYSGFARRILWEHKYGQSLGTWISESFDLHTQNVKI